MHRGMHADVIVIGGGVIGVAVARALALRHRTLRILVLEKEGRVAEHQSGRNSGVVHVGCHQRPGTFKAAAVVEGARRLKAFCRDHRIPLVEKGILFAAPEEGRRPVLQELLRRGRANGARVQLVGPDQIRRIEPEAQGVAGLWAPEGASVDSAAFVRGLAAEARRLGVRFEFATAVLDLTESAGVRVRTSKGSRWAGAVVNAAGLHADRLAHRMGVGRAYHVVPFRGEYFDLVDSTRLKIRSHIYPAPDLRFPFVGVHVSRRTDGRVSVGPGALWVPARESYSGLRPCWRDLGGMISFMGFWRLTMSGPFRRLLIREGRKAISRRAVWADAVRLVPSLRPSDLGRRWSGVRAQLVSRDGRLVDDLIIEQTRHSLHVLNAVSPALTCALPVADAVSDRLPSRF